MLLLCSMRLGIGHSQYKCYQRLDQVLTALELTEITAIGAIKPL